MDMSSPPVGRPKSGQGFRAILALCLSTLLLSASLANPAAAAPSGEQSAETPIASAVDSVVAEPNVEQPAVSAGAEPTAPVLAAATSQAPESLVFVIDTSGSMAGTPLVQAKDALGQGIDVLAPEQAAGLRSYGGVCTDGGDLLVPVATGNREELRTAVGGLSASGNTPTPAALRAAVADLPPGSSRTIVLISDGQSTCGDPCPVAEELVASSNVGFTVQTVGFNPAGNAPEELRCIADVTGGNYVEVTDTEGLAEAIQGVVSGQPPDDACRVRVEGSGSTYLELLDTQLTGDEAGGWYLEARVRSLRDEEWIGIAANARGRQAPERIDPRDIGIGDPQRGFEDGWAKLGILPAGQTALFAFQVERADSGFSITGNPHSWSAAGGYVLEGALDELLGIGLDLAAERDQLAVMALLIQTLMASHEAQELESHIRAGRYLKTGQSVVNIIREFQMPIIEAMVRLGVAETFGSAEDAIGTVLKKVLLLFRLVYRLILLVPERIDRSAFPFFGIGVTCRS